ncbi:MAG: VCBS repeat-containing protein [Ignavibacteria bacterium]|nr:VCBS repeat-containing protein [Ignavibacteria bacterium]MBT8382442.1 VCBS repeat-containing protein [Ignavibacteria bacterium]MBT8392819.1 VCBS repeat-containing protein [Ignavibacteria bacterium]NNJ53597.1 VCBS repeat-containing protein [Ignavibacteriaceae bacterium]NNL20204.1 VCBS repeat-containing protein [Ignavibacteriaceae bacterium]
MNKSEDIKKRLKEGKAALKKGKRNNILLFLFLLLTQTINSQIPINGFCIRDSYQIPAGYEKILSVDLNRDKNDEFIVYSPSLKKIGIVVLEKNNIIDLIEFKVEYEFSQIKYLNDTNSNSNKFICVSRKNRLIAEYEFSLNSPPELKSRITFDSYPENIFIGNVNSDNVVEALVSGVGFDGLSILVRKEGRLAENKIISGESFSHAVFADLSNDGFADVAAFNVLDNSAHFFYNDTQSKFNLVRSSRSNENFESLNAVDLNNDKIQDLVYNYGTTLNVSFGDFQSAYDKKKLYQLKNKPHAQQFGDYNNDKFLDLAYISSETGNINLLFGKNGGNFYPEITYTNIPNTSSITSFTQKDQQNLIILSKEGFVTTISSFKDNFISSSLIPAVNAGTVKKFDLYNDGMFDISFIDNSDFSFRIITRNKKGVPENFYLYKLDESHKAIAVDDILNERKTFYCYSKEKQLIEFLKINFKDNSINHKGLYSPGKIKDLVLQRVDSSLVNIYLLYTKGNKLFLGKFEHRELSLTFKEYPFIDRDVICAELFVDKEIKAYYWKQKLKSVFLNEVIIKTGPDIYKGIAGFSIGDSIKISLAASNQLFNKKPWLISLIKNNNETLLISFTENGYKVLQPLKEEFGIKDFPDAQVVFKKLPNDELEIPIIYLPELKTLNKLIISKDGKSYSLKLIAGKLDINNYFFDKFNGRNYHLVFSDSEKGSISLIQLKN